MFLIPFLVKINFRGVFELYITACPSCKSVLKILTGDKNLATSQSVTFTELKGRTIRKVMGGEEGNFRAAGIVFRYQIPCMNFF